MSDITDSMTNERETPLRIVNSAGAQLSPVYPVARLMKSNTIEASRMLDEAKAALENSATQASQIIADAEQRADELRIEAERDGRRRGLRDVELLLEEIQYAFTNARNEIARNSARLSVIFARNILNAQLEASQALFVELVRNALERARYYSQITIVLHPEDIEFVRSVGDNLLEPIVFASSIQFREDAGLRRFGCRIETEMGALEASLDGQLERMSKLIAERCSDYMAMEHSAESGNLSAAQEEVEQ